MMKFEKPLLLREMTPRLLRIYLFASMGAMNFGYDNNWWAGIIGIDTFAQDYGRYNGPDTPRSLPSTWLSAASGTPLAGWIIGCFVSSYLTSNIGRKMTIVVLCVIALVGMVIQCAVHNYWALMVGRLINAFSMGIEANCIPMYMAELAPPAIRGALVNFYQSWLMIGAVLAAATVYATNEHLTGKWTYLTPIVVQIGPPVLLLSAVWFIPESPRWLLSKNRKTKAFEALQYMRHGSSTDDEVSSELELIDLALEQEKELHRATGYADCFKGVNFHRTMVAVGVQCLQQAQGNSFTTTYIVLFLQSLGVENPLLIKTARACCSFAGTLFAFYLTDKIGRRMMLIGGAFLMAILLWVTSGLAAWTPGGVTGSAAQGAIACIILHGAISTACWGSAMWTVTTEVATNQLRERTIAVATVLGFATSLVITYVNPYVQGEPGNLGARVGLIYASMSFLAMAFVYFVVPEMKGRSLEELDEMFHSGVPAWRSKGFVATGLGAQITDIQNNNSGRLIVGKDGVAVTDVEVGLPKDKTNGREGI